MPKMSGQYIFPIVFVGILSVIMGLLYVVDKSDYTAIAAPQPNPEAYTLKNLAVPRLSGRMMQLFAWILETWPLGALLLAKVKLDSEMDVPLHLAAQPHFTYVMPTFEPLVNPTADIIEAARKSNFSLDAFAKPAINTASGFHFRGVEEYAAAYRSKQTTPVEVARAVLDAVKATEALKPPMRFCTSIRDADVMQQAQQSAERHANGKPLSVFDGVPVAIKEEFDAKGHPTTAGTSFLKTVAERDATAVQRLRAAGAIIIGKTNMHEWGAGVSGLNPHHGFCRNPYNPKHMTGGSSSGSAAIVGAGIVPVALGADGGGSIRMPAALCGVTGLKPTYGRVSGYGAYPLAWTIGHAGPIAASPRDAALAYAVMAGADPHDRRTAVQPPVYLGDFNQKSLSGLRVGVYTVHNEDSDPEVAAVGKSSSEKIVLTCVVCSRPSPQQTDLFLRKLVKLGATVRNITIPNILALYRAHAITISSEMSMSAAPHMVKNRFDFSAETRALLAIGRSFGSRDYIAAQRVRTFALDFMDKLFSSDDKGIDVILTPATAITAPEIPAEAYPYGMMDSTVMSRIMMFAGIPNFTGHPAMSFPIAYDRKGLPIAAQLIAKHWNEDLILRVAHFATVHSSIELKQPQVYHDVLAAAIKAKQG